MVGAAPIAAIWPDVHGGSALVALIDVAHEGAVQHALRFRRKLRVERTHRRIDERWMIARVAVGQQVMQGGSQRVQVRTRVGIALVLLGRRVTRGAQRRCLFALRVTGGIGAGDAEVNQVRALIFSADDDVGGLDVAMHNGRVLLRQVVQDIQDLPGVAQRIALLHGLVGAIHALLEVLAIDELLHHEVARSLLEVIRHVRHEGMVDVGQGCHFALEVAHIVRHFGRVGIVGDQFFDDDGLAVQAQIGRQQGRAHATLAEHLFDDVAAALQTRTGGERAGVGSSHYLHTCGQGAISLVKLPATIGTIANSIAILSVAIRTFHCLCLPSST